MYDLKQVELENYPGVYASCLVWGKAEEGSARELLNRAEAMPEGEDLDGPPPQDEWLLEFLSSGPKLNAEVIEEGAEAGFSKDQLRRARERLGVRSEKNGYQGKWCWILPEDTFSDENSKGGKDGSNFEVGATQKNPATFATFDKNDDDAEDF